MAIKDRAALKVEKNTNYNDNTTGDVTPNRVRTQQESLIDSMLLRDDYAVIVVDSSPSSIELDFQNQVSPTFLLSPAIAGNKVITFINSDFAVKFTLLLDIASNYNLTFPDSVIMDDIRFTSPDWNPGEGAEGKYKTEGTFDNTNWWVDVSQSIYV